MIEILNLRQRYGGFDNMQIMLLSREISKQNLVNL